VCLRGGVMRDPVRHSRHEHPRRQWWR
jgi:hypothetical protein